MPQHPNERQTRASRIDPQLARAGWGAGDRRLLSEYVLFGAASRTGEDASEHDSRGREFADYVLLRPGDRPLTIVEAKKTSRDPLLPQRLGNHHVDDSGT